MSNGFKKGSKGGIARRKLATRVAGIVAIVIFLITVFLVAINTYVNLTETAHYIFYIMFALLGVSVAVWLVLFVVGVVLSKGGTVEEKADAAAKGQIWCSQQQVDEIGKVFDKEITNCPVCGTQLENSRDYIFTANVLVRKDIEGVYVSRNYSPQVEQAYEVVSEYKTFPNARRCACPKCKWEAFEGRYETFSSPSVDIGYCKQFHMGKLYGKRKAPANTGAGIFKKKQ